jgi:hypothetical protein
MYYPAAAERAFIGLRASGQGIATAFTRVTGQVALAAGGFLALKAVLGGVVSAAAEAELVQAKLNAVKAELRRRMHDPVPAVGTWLRSVVGGHIRYYGVPTNSHALHIFRFQVGRLWHRTLSRRSQTGRVTWDRMRRLIDRWLPPARVCHPYPLRRLGVIT